MEGEGDLGIEEVCAVTSWFGARWATAADVRESAAGNTLAAAVALAVGDQRKKAVWAEARAARLVEKTEKGPGRRQSLGA